jgi:hypothetical protein
MNDIPDPAEACLLHLVAFIRTGDIKQASTAAGAVVAYLATLEGQDSHLAALDELQVELVKRVERTGITDEAEDRHVAVDDAIEQARTALDSTPGELRAVAKQLTEGIAVGASRKPGT